MFKIVIIAFILSLAVVRPEPPISSYLPARADTSSINDGQDDLSTQYGIPDFDNGRINKNVAATSDFNSPASNMDNDLPQLYGIPVGARNRFGSEQSSGLYIAPNSGIFKENSDNKKPSNSYDVPIVDGNNIVDDFSGNNGNNGRLSSDYGVPIVNKNNVGGFGGNNNNGRPSSSYGLPGGNNNNNNAKAFGRNNDKERPSISYGVPAGRNGNNFANRNMNEKNSFTGVSSTRDNKGDLSSDYGRDHGTSNGDSDNNDYLSVRPKLNGGNFDNVDNVNFRNRESGDRGYNETAQRESSKAVRYEFSYEVKDKRSGSIYGHTETREGNHAKGEFNVLLPDGRKQIVEYEADEDGFKPHIRYEGEANTGEYGSNGLNSNDGYSFGKPNNAGSGLTDNSRFNGDSGNAGYPNAQARVPADFNNGESNDYQSGRPGGGQSFSRNNDGDLSDNIGGYVSDVLSNNNIGDMFKQNDDNTGDIGGNKANSDNDGYQY